MRKYLGCVVALLLAGCPDIDTDAGEGPGELGAQPIVEFDPANNIVPFPNNLVIDPTTGRVNIPAPACETPTAKTIREQELNMLDGFGTFEAAQQVTLTAPVDETTLAGHVVMYQRAVGMAANDPAAVQQVPVTVAKATTLRFDAADCASPRVINAINVIPLVPLQEHGTYVIALLSGIKTETGADYLPSVTFALIRGAKSPVTLDAMGNVVSEDTPLVPGADANANGIPDELELQGLARLWGALAPGLAFLEAKGVDRKSVLVAWEVTTQTTTDPLDPAVAGSPASTLPTTQLVGTSSITCQINALTCPAGYDRTAVPFNQCPGGDSNTQCRLKISLGAAACAGACSPIGTGAGTIYGTGNAVCAQVGCIAIGDILAALMPAPSYLTATPNPLAGGTALPGAWTDPVHPTAQGSVNLQVLIFIPAGATPPYNAVVFGHDISRSKNDLFAIAPQLAASPGQFASVAIDDALHGSRAIQISNDPTLGCDGTPDPTVDVQCFEPPLPADLAAQRDVVRQSVLDMERLVLAVKACGTTGCASANSAASLAVDPAHITFLGMGLGSILGSDLTAMAPDVKAAVLNTTGVGIYDILENTQTLELRCALVDSLIDAGVVQGAKFDPVNMTGLCTTDAWKAQPGYQQFAVIARWLIDPADPANFLVQLAAKPLLMQEVVGDEVIPNVATDHQGTLLGQTPVPADLYVPVCAGTTTSCRVDAQCPGSVCLADPSAGVFGGTIDPWLRYMNLPVSGSFPGNTFSHGSLLRPANSTTDGQLGTARIQTDAITFLVLNH